MSATRERPEDAQLIDVCAVDALVDGGVTAVTVAGRRAVALRVRERVYLVNGLCPHRGGPLAAGKLTYRTGGCPGEISVQRNSPAIACPWHGWEFSLVDGRAVADPRVRVRVYDVEVRDGRVLVRSPGAVR